MRKRKKKEGRKLGESDVFTIRIPKGARREVIEALNGMRNRNQVMLNLVELVFVKAGIGEALLESLLSGVVPSFKAQGAVEKPKEAVHKPFESDIPVQEAEENIFANEALNFMHLIKGK